MAHNPWAATCDDRASSVIRKIDVIKELFECFMLSADGSSQAVKHFVALDIFSCFYHSQYSRKLAFLPRRANVVLTRSLKAVTLRQFKMISTHQTIEEPERPLGPPAIQKLASWDLFRSLGSPKYVVAVRYTSMCVNVSHHSTKSLACRSLWSTSLSL